MAEVLGVTAAVVSVISVSQSMSRLILSLRRINDPKFKLLQTRLLLEKRRLAIWALAMRVDDVEDLKTRVHPDDLNTVEGLFLDVQNYFSQAMGRLKHLAPHQRAPTTTKGFFARLNWIYGGFEDLQLLVETIEALVNALYTIEPPPRYGASRVLPEPSAQYACQEDFSSNEIRVEVSSQDVVPDFQAQHNTTSSNILPLESTQYPGHSNSIENLFRMIVHTMNVISLSLPDKHLLVPITWRLKVWASNILQGTFSLDHVLAEEHDNEKIHAPLWGCILRALVDVASMQQCWLESLSDRPHTPDTTSRLAKTQLELLAFLGSADVVAFSMEQPFFCLDDGKDDNQDIALGRITQAVDSLYRLSPAIRGIRRQAMLEYERITKKQEGPEANEAKVTNSLAGRSPSAEVEQPLRQEMLVTEESWLETAQAAMTDFQRSLEVAEKESTNKGHPIDRAYSQVFKKQLDRLTEFAKPVRSKQAAELVRNLLDELANAPNSTAKSKAPEAKTKTTEKSSLKASLDADSSGVEAAGNREVAEKVASIVDEIVRIR